MSHPRLSHDPWLTERLGKTAFHLVGSLDAQGDWQRDIERQIAAESLFADVKVPVDAAAGVEAVESLGFSLMDTNLRFLASCSALSETDLPGIGFAAPDMADDVGSIAERAFVLDRFHRDAKTAPHAGRIKRDWARNFFSGGRGEWMVTASREGHAVGFLQLLRSGSDELVIDLIAVDECWSGRGLARGMIGFAAKKCGVLGNMVVGTQAANYRSVRLYEGLGFRLSAADYVFHHHGERS